MPFVSPSLSQSAADQIVLVVTGVPEPPTQGLFGSASVPLGVPSPSQSAACHNTLFTSGVAPTA